MVANGFGQTSRAPQRRDEPLRSLNSAAHIRRLNLFPNPKKFFNRQSQWQHR